MAEILRTPRGTYDILPSEVGRWLWVEQQIRACCDKFQFKEIRTPILEYTELFQRGVGETTDIVQKEMFTFALHNHVNSSSQDKKSFTLRPEGTASTVRALIQHKLYAEPAPVKVWYMGPMFRYERPQAGRNRQFHQFGVEAFACDNPGLDSEIILFAQRLLESLGLQNVQLDINSVGCPVCRATHKQLMMDKLSTVKAELCEDCHGRYDKNPLRILDCKNTSCQEKTKDAPLLIDHLCPHCDEHFSKVRQHLDALRVRYNLNPRLVRGLDYYTQTAFEFMEDSIGAMSTICGGGRYNGLVEQLGGPVTPGIGFALGIERLLLALEQQEVILPSSKKTDVYIVALGDKAYSKSLLIADQLRSVGVSVDLDHMQRSMKAQMKAANRLQAAKAIIIGDDELQSGVSFVRDMQNSEQEQVKIDNIIEYIIGGIKK